MEVIPLLKIQIIILTIQTQLCPLNMISITSCISNEPDLQFSSRNINTRTSKKIQQQQQQQQQQQKHVM